jgi:hypothetical protein
MKRTASLQTLLFLLTGLLALGMVKAHAQIETDYFGRAENIPVNKDTKSPVGVLGGDVYGSEVFIEGRTDANLDLFSIQAEMQNTQRREREARKTRDESIRKDIVSGEPVTILICPDHFTQITFMRDGEIVYPRRAYPGQEGLLIIEKQKDSPFLYLSSTVMLDGQTTNLFVETEEDGRVQTYVFNIQVTTPNNIREQVQVNLVNDLTPPIRGGTGSEAERQTQAQTLLGLTPKTAAGRTSMNPSGVHGKFSREDVKTYFNTMIKMAENYGEAKKTERSTGRIVYRDQDITPFPGGKVTFVDPVENTQWRVREIWFFPRYDAILLGVTCYNPTSRNSMWDYSQMKWKVNQRNPPFDTTAASPTAMQTPAGKINVIWYLLQGNRIDPMAEFSPVFPRAERRGERSGTGTSQGK